MFFRSECNMTTVVDVEKNGLHRPKDEGERPKDLHNCS